MKKDGKSRPPVVGKRAAGSRPSPARGHHSLYPPDAPLVRQRSVAIAGGALGVAPAGFVACAGKDVQRNGYASKEDCEHDYATGQCMGDTAVTPGGGYHYYGPWYRSDWRNGPIGGDPGPGRNLAAGSDVPSFTGHGPTSMDFGRRGGFGSSGRVSARG